MDSEKARTLAIIETEEENERRSYLKRKILFLRQ